MINELSILREVKSNFVAEAKFAFQDRSNLYLGLELLSGGSLRYHLKMGVRFSESQARFIIACVIQGTR